MLNGFAYEEFQCGVPMVPNPKSEAWLLCALKRSQPYQHCDRIERESGNDDAASTLKDQLEAELGRHPMAELLVSRVRDGKVDAQKIHMPSFIQFKRCLAHRLRPREGTRCDVDSAHGQ